MFVIWQIVRAEVSLVTGDTLVEFVFGQEVEEMSEEGATFVHKVKNRRLTVEHPRRVVASLKMKIEKCERA